jgi:hypothetical protein
MPAPDHPLWKEWLVAENTLQEARDELRTVEHLDLANRNFRKLGGRTGSLSLWVPSTR